MATVSARNLAIAFGSAKVIQNLSLEVAEGEFIVLLGPSGCGKSTLLNSIAGFQEIDEGEIWIGGKNVTWDEPKDRGIGMVLQSYTLYPGMTVDSKLNFGLTIAKFKRKRVRKRGGKVAVPYGTARLGHAFPGTACQAAFADYGAPDSQRFAQPSSAPAT